MMHPDVAVLLIQFVALFYIADVDSAVVVVDRLQKRSEPDLSEDVQQAVASRNEDFLPLLMFLDNQWRWAQSRNARDAALKEKRLADEESMREDVQAWERMLKGDSETENMECGSECQKLKREIEKRAATINGNGDPEEIITHAPKIEATNSSVNTSPEWKGWWDVKNKDVEGNLVDSELDPTGDGATEVLSKEIAAGTSMNDEHADTAKGVELTTAASSGEANRCKSCCCKCPQKGGNSEPMCSNKCEEKERRGGDHHSHPGGEHHGHQGDDHHSHSDHHSEDHRGHQGEDHRGHQGEDHHGHQGEDHRGHQSEDHRGHQSEDHRGHQGEDHRGHQGEDHRGHQSEDHRGHKAGDHRGHKASDHNCRRGGDHHSHHGDDHSHHGSEHHHGSGHRHHHDSEIQHSSDSEIERALEIGDANTLMAQCLNYLGVTEATLDEQPERVAVAARLCQRRIRNLLASRNSNDVVYIQPEILSDQLEEEDAPSPHLLAVLIARRAALNSEAQATVDDSRSTDPGSTNDRHSRFDRRQVLPTQQNSADYETKKRVRKANTGDAEQSTTKIPTDTKETSANQDESGKGSTELGTSRATDNAAALSGKRVRSSVDNQGVKGESEVQHPVNEGLSIEVTSEVSLHTPDVERKVRSQEHSEQTGFWENVKKFLSHFRSAESIPNSVRNRRNQTLVSDAMKESADSGKMTGTGSGDSLTPSNSPERLSPIVTPHGSTHGEKKDEKRAGVASVKRSSRTKGNSNRAYGHLSVGRRLMAEQLMLVRRERQGATAGPSTFCPPISLKDAMDHESAGHAICASPILLALAVLSILAKHTF